MMEHDKQDVSRRDFLQRLSAIGLAGVGGGVLLSACGGGSEQEGEAEAASQQSESATADAGFSCDDLSGLSDAQQEQRRQMTEALNYVEQTPNVGQNCANCALYRQPAGGEPCGGCQLFPGPVHPDGYCNSWAPA